MKNLLINWKTTLSGVLLLAIAVMTVMGKITHDQALAITATLGGLGLIVAKDGNVHGIGPNATTDVTAK